MNTSAGVVTEIFAEGGSRGKPIRTVSSRTGGFRTRYSKTGGSDTEGL